MGVACASQILGRPGLSRVLLIRLAASLVCGAELLFLLVEDFAAAVSPL